MKIWNHLRVHLTMCMPFRPDEFQLGFLKVLYGSKMEKDSSLYDIVTADYPPYEVLSTKMAFL